MKKSLLALAAMGAFAGAAQAQSSVTVYGLYDGGLNVNTRESKATSATVATVLSNSDLTGNQQTSSRLGFRGSEDLGGGLSANFNLELGFNPGTGSVDTTTVPGISGQNQSDSVRTSVVGLSSKALGEIRIGRQLSGAFVVGAGDIFAGSNMVGDIVASSHGGATGNTTNTRVYRQATRFNGASYFTPNISGFVARLDYSNSMSTGGSLTDVGAAAATSATGAGVNNITSAQVANRGISGNYLIGPVKIAAGHHQVTSNGNATNAAGTVSKTIINQASIAYIQGPLTAQYTLAQNKTDAGAVNTTTMTQASKVSANRFAVQYAVTPTIVPFAMYGTGKSEMTVAAPTASDNTAYLLGANYHLSKRTRLYGVYGNQKAEVKSTTASAETKEYGLGIVHTF